jgi:hypothetical protein
MGEGAGWRNDPMYAHVNKQTKKPQHGIERKLEHKRN